MERGWEVGRPWCGELRERVMKRGEASLRSQSLGFLEKPRRLLEKGTKKRKIKGKRKRKKK